MPLHPLEDLTRESIFPIGISRLELLELSRRNPVRGVSLFLNCPAARRQSLPAVSAIVKPDAILQALQQFTDRERIEFLPVAPDLQPVSPYAPLHKYALDLKNGAKPESAAEDLFTALCKDLLGFEPTRQVGVREGYVDFMLPERRGEPLPLELKPLFQRDGPDALWRSDANPKNHLAQVKKYLRDHEYLILTDLRTAWFFCARDFFFEDKPFAQLPFADFLGRCRASRSLLDAELWEPRGKRQRHPDGRCPRGHVGGKARGGHLRRHGQPAWRVCACRPASWRDWPEFA
ncbi:MAG TPA: hypothetical protein VI136_27020 [Verrucomicrobiae bacterium]